MDTKRTVNKRGFLGSLFDSIRSSHEQAAESLDNFEARVKGQRAYYEGSPSTPARKQAVRKKMGTSGY